jgi:hypothetical protein
MCLVAPTLKALDIGDMGLPIGWAAPFKATGLVVPVAAEFSGQQPVGGHPSDIEVMIHTRAFVVRINPSETC